MDELEGVSMGAIAFKDRTAHDDQLAHLAAEKIAVGALLRLSEVAAALDVAPSTVHRLPLPSIRLGRSLRFDPNDVQKLIRDRKEPVVALIDKGGESCHL